MVSRKERQAQIHNSWGFECTCSHCSQAKLLSDASDGRIAAINRIWDQLRINFVGHTRDENGTEVELIETMIKLYEQERLYAHIADAWAWAAKAYRKAGKRWEALAWAHQAQEGVLVYEGPTPRLGRMEDMISELSKELGLSDGADDSKGDGS